MYGSFAPHPGLAVIVKPVGLDQRKRDIALEASITREVNELAAAFAEQALDLISTAGKLGRQRWLRACQVDLPYAGASL